LLQIEDIGDQNTLEKFPNAAPALSEAITVEVNEGEMLFIPAYTWIQIKFLRMGFATGHFGFADKVTPNQISAILLMHQIWKQFLFCFSNVRKEWKDCYARRILSLGRHPRGTLAGAPVC
jgi:hypothetical protein